MEAIAPAYTADGVDLKEGDSFSSFAASICRASYRNSPFIEVRDWSKGRFRGPRTFKLKGVSRECELSADPDGNGTKVILTSSANTPEESGRDLFEMTGMDGVRYGGRNVLLVDQLDTSTLDKAGTLTNQFYRRLMTGVEKVAAEQKVVLLKGETAEMGPCVSSEDPEAVAKYLLCGVMLSIYHPDAFITGEGLKHGQVVVALAEDGLRVNGDSSARKGFARRYGPEWYKCAEALEDIKAAACPSTAYGDFLSDVNGWNSLEAGRPAPRIKVHAIAHITGGGIPSKLFEDILKPRGLSAKLTDLPEPPDIMRKLAAWRGVSGKEPYEIWHGGAGVIVILDEGDVSKFLYLALVAGIRPKVAGSIVGGRGAPTLTIHSKFDGQVLTWQ